MAGDWIKMRGNLWDDPRVARLCDLTNQGEAPVIGGLYWLWATADQHTEDGVMHGLTVRQIDRKTGVPGLGEALQTIGWLDEHADGVRLVRFSEHNGASAKRRSLDAQRKASVRKVSARDADNLRKTDEFRDVSASDADKQRTDSGQIARNCGARERERVRDIEIPPLTPTGGERAGDVGPADDHADPTQPHHLPPATGSTGTHPMAGTICALLKRLGLTQVNPSHPKLVALLQAGATAGQFEDAARKAIEGRKGFGYAMAIVEREAREARELGHQLATQRQARAAADLETPWDRAARLRVEEIAPQAARKAPGTTMAATFEAAQRFMRGEVIDVTPTETTPQIAGQKP